MRRFVRNIGIFAVLFILLWVVIIALDFLVIKNQYLYNYQASILDKVERAGNIDGPKILLVGNSNVSFGFDSGLLERELGLPVVNMGIHSGLSNAFQEDMVKPFISDGDIVLLCHNNFSDGTNISDPSLAWITIEKHTELWPIVRESNRRDMIQAYPLYALDCLLLGITGRGNKIEDSCFSRTSFNEYGDIIYKPDFEKKATSTLFYDGAVRVPSINDDTIDRINEFNDYVVSRGAILLVVGYPIAEYEYTPSKENYIAFKNELSRRLACPVISDYTDYFIPCEFFYNTMLHLTEEGVKMRTRQTAEDVKRYLSKQK